MPRSGRTGWRFALPTAERKRPLSVACHTEATTSPPTAFDRAICGWPADEVPVDLAEDAILARLLELNRERTASPHWCPDLRGWFPVTRTLGPGLHDGGGPRLWLTGR
jgi:hypothetical protein